MKILLVEDNQEICEAISLYAELKNYQLDYVNDGNSALEAVNSNGYSFLILDVGLPDIDGFELLKQINQSNITLPVLFLTARIHKDDRITGLKLGADDYLTKPFNMEELFLRIENINRRFYTRIQYIDEYKFITDEKIVYFNGRKLHLSNYAYKLLYLLVSNKNQTVTREEILKQVWGIDFSMETRTVDMHIKMIRDEIMNNSIKTIRGKGYMYEKE